MMEDEKLPPREAAFVAAYTGSCFGLGGASARAAGYTSNLAASRVTACNLLKKPRIRAAIDAALAQRAAEAEQERLLRLARRRERLDRMYTLLHERETRYRAAGDAVPGGETGLLVATPEFVRVYAGGDDDSGEFTPLKDRELVLVHQFDAALIREIRADEEALARELGQWTDRKDVTSGGRSIGGPMVLGDLLMLPEEEIDQRIARAEGDQATEGLSG